MEGNVTTVGRGFSESVTTVGRGSTGNVTTVGCSSESVLGWDVFFMMSAVLASRRSKDPSTQVGCVIVNGENRIVSSGYNGFPNGIDDSSLPWTKNSEVYSENKYAYVVHAEINSILNSYTTNLKGCIMYCTLFPCNDCAKSIIQKGIVKIIYGKLPKNIKSNHDATIKMFNLSGVETCLYKGCTTVKLTI